MLLFRVANVLPTLAAGFVAGTVATVALEEDWIGGKYDVPYVPTPPSVVARMLDLADVRRGDFVIDLGSGDGRIAIAAVTRGARALGVDIDPVRIREANANAAKTGVTELVSFREQDLFDTPIADATVLTMYLLDSVNLRLRPRILAELRPGTRVVSHAFNMREWRPDRHEKVDGRDVFLWIVPAQVGGRWQVSHGERRLAIELTQQFQEIRGTAMIDGRSIPLKDARLRGDQIQFTVETGTAGPLAFRGRVAGDTIEGAPVQSRSGDRSRSAERWRAIRGS
jgi:SAM-dependent methyltransferase